jgi:uncharacterized membrane protein YcaP (DUF421 family)
MSHPFYWFLSTLAARTAIVLLYLVAGLRVLGKRQIGQMNIYDLVLVMALANSVQNAMTAGRGELSIGVVSAGTLLLIGRWLTGVFVRHPRLQERLIGSPTVIINDGELVRDHMRREHLTEEQVLTALRQHGLCEPKDAKMAVLEVDGTLSVVPKGATSDE